MQETPDTAPSAPSGDLAPRAIDLAARWVAEAAEFPADASAQRLAGVLKDPNGLPFTIGFVDGVMRPESLTAAASTLSRIAPLAPEFLPWYLRGATVQASRAHWETRASCPWTVARPRAGG